MRQTKNVGGGHVTSNAISSSASVEQEKYLAAVGEYLTSFSKLKGWRPSGHFLMQQVCNSSSMKYYFSGIH